MSINQLLFLHTALMFPVTCVRLGGGGLTIISMAPGAMTSLGLASLVPMYEVMVSHDQGEYWAA